MVLTYGHVSPAGLSRLFLIGVVEGFLGQTRCGRPQVTGTFSASPGNLAALGCREWRHLLRWGQPVWHPHSRMTAEPPTREGFFLLPQEISRPATQVWGTEASLSNEEGVRGSWQDLGAKEWDIPISGPTPGSLQLSGDKNVEIRRWGDSFTGGWKLGKPPSSWLNSVAFLLLPHSVLARGL